MKKILLLVVVIGALYAQNENLFPVQVEEKMPELTFTDIDGNSVNINKLDSENILLVFPRGKVTEATWCPICHYQYLEMAMIAEKYNLKKKYDLDIFFIFPYSADSLESWTNAFPNSLNTIENWKNPKGENAENPNVIAWAEYSKEFFSHSYEFDKEEFDYDIPILLDADREVSNGLMLFREEWGGTKVAQNVPTIFLLDKERRVRFKYFSQMTNDRPSGEYLVKYLKRML